MYVVCTASLALVWLDGCVHACVNTLECVCVCMECVSFCFSVSMPFVTKISRYCYYCDRKHLSNALFQANVYKQMNVLCLCVCMYSYILFYCLHDRFIYICAFVYRSFKKKHHFVYHTFDFFCSPCHNHQLFVTI